MKHSQRFKLGILFNFKPTWMGGIIYILNLIKTLDYLDDEDKPYIYLFYNDNLSQYVASIQYPYLEKVKWAFPGKISGYVRSWLTLKNIFAEEILNDYDLDGLYPLRDFPVKDRSTVKLVSWYADLQYKYYPEFFTRKKRIESDLRIKFILRNSNDLVVSSRAVENDLRKFFKIGKQCRLHVYHFVSVLDDFSGLKIDLIRKRYHLPEDYYIVSNQFHRHKNHLIVVKAIKQAKERGTKIHIAMTGRFPEASYSPYMKELHDYIDEHNLKSQIYFLGVIPRAEQLFLMRHAQAVIQPSLFEGWSTVIEDARSLQVPVIASDLDVNKEQLGNSGLFFNPDSADALSEILMNMDNRIATAFDDQKYQKRIKSAAKSFMQVFTDQVEFN